MKNKKSNVWSFATAKLQAKTRISLLILVLAVIGFSIAACDNGSDSTATTYAVTVNGGNGSGSYAAGATVSISATASSGQTFTNWTVISGGATLANPNSASTTFTMPANAVTVTANFTGGSGDNDNTPSTGIGTGSIENRKYRVEVYNLSSETYTYGGTTYGNKTYQDVVRADMISKGASIIAPSPYTNQTFSDITSILSSAATSIGYTSGVAGMTDSLTEALQTNNQNGWWRGFYSGSTYRFFYVNRTGKNPNYYTVEVYNISSATYTYGGTTYGGKTLDDVVRADMISRGATIIAPSPYTNQTFSGVTSILSTTATNIGYTSGITGMTDSLTEALQTNNQSRWWRAFYSGSTYRFFYVKQE
ncbi:hypothetical protein R84B8_00303 [Treponema sp. R8-4-B8]